MATYNNIKKIKIGDNIFNLYDSGNSGGTITGVTTTAGAHTAISKTSGAVSFNVPTTAAHVGIKFGYTTSGNNRAVLQDSNGNLYVTQKDDNSDTKNTAGSTNSSSKLFLIGATSQAANPQTYSHDTAYVGTDGCLYSGGSKVLTSAVTSLSTSQGAYTAKTSATGAVTIVIPTRTSHITNDSGFLTSDDITDYIVEQGTSGIWTYRKWNSGVAECWGVELKSTAISSSWNGLYYSSELGTNFPTDFFVDAPTTVSIYVSSALSVWVYNSATFTKDTIKYYLIRPAQVTTGNNFNVRFYAIGRWK